MQGKPEYTVDQLERWAHSMGLAAENSDWPDSAARYYAISKVIARLATYEAALREIEQEARDPNVENAAFRINSGRIARKVLETK